MGWRPLNASLPVFRLLMAIKIKRVYRSVQQGQKDGWPDDVDGIDLTVSNYNMLAHIAANMIRVNPTRDRKEVLTATIGSFRKVNVVQDGRWVPRITYTLASGIEFQNPLADQPTIESRA